jgi:SAM-dependent methyltransferase
MPTKSTQSFKVKDYLRHFTLALRGEGRYKPSEFWRRQLGQHGRALRGPGHGRLSEEENALLYKNGERALEKLCGDLKVNWKCRFAEIGPGNGYWLRWLRHHGVTSYTAFDVTDVLFAMIRQDHPDAALIRLDVTEQALSDKFDVLLMIDVTQHIVSKRKFGNAMKNCRGSIAPGGHFVVTSWLRPYRRVSNSEVMRPLEHYLEYFADWKLTGPIEFRDKFIMAFTSPVS